MLEPQTRHLLFDSLRPPDGYDLDFAITTTYSLDLLALLVAPVGFTLFELSGAPDTDLKGSDALVLLRTLRRYADRMAIFCQSGRIAVPKRHTLLFGHLESSVVEVTAPTPNKSFHPKVWVLRYVAQGEPVHYRLLCLSRNLTFDRCWDTVLSFDGELLDRTRGIAVNRPLADFVAALPGMAVRKGEVPERILKTVAVASDELRRVEFEIPRPFDDFQFWPLGLPNYRKWPFEKAHRTLVISPFLCDSSLDRLAGTAGRDVLISRPEELAELPADPRDSFAEVLTLDPDLSAEQAGMGDEPTAGAIGPAGLHAKLVVAEVNGTSHVYTGSANATAAAFNGNVEFLVELIGRRKECGIDAILTTAPGRTGLRDMVVPYTPPVEPSIEGPEKKLLEDRVEAVRRALASRQWSATVECETGSREYDVTLRAEASANSEPLPPDARVRCRPVVLPDSFAVALGHGPDFSATFDQLAFESLSSFFAFDVELAGAPEAIAAHFVLNARLDGAPEGRSDAITQYLLRDRKQVVRFLLLLLADREDEALLGGDGVGVAGESMGDASEGSSRGSEALLEPLLRALDHEPTRLDDVARILSDLRSTEDGRAKLPAGMEEIWAPIWAAREASRV
jgi:hypothetical protein